MVEDNSFPSLDNLDLNIKKNLLKFSILRVDLKNFGLGNEIELLDGYENIQYKDFPDWFSDKYGVGLLIQSFTGSLNFNIKLKNEGNLKIALRGVHLLDKNGERLPVYIHITNFFINDEKICENELVWHDEPYRFEKKVKDSEVINIKIEWLPMNKESIYKNSLNLNNIKLKKQNKTLKKDLNKLKLENSNLNNQINEFKEKNFNLMLILEKIAKENYNMKTLLESNDNSDNKLSFFNKK